MHGPPAPPPYGPPPYGPATYGQAGAPGGPPPGDAPRREPGAAVSLVLGVLSMVCMGPLLGVPAIVLGLVARGKIARSGGTLGGGGLAIGGIVTGSVGTFTFVAWMALAFAGAFFGRNATSHGPALSTPPVPVATAPTPARGPTVVDARPGAPLRGQLAAEGARAAAAGETLVVQTAASWCKPCKEVAAALREDELREELEGVRLVRVDVDVFDGELAALGLARPSVPWFFLVDPDVRVRGALSADAWDANDAPSIARALGPFVRGARDH